MAPTNNKLVVDPARERHITIDKARTRAERHIPDIQVLAGFPEILEFQEEAL
jgi:hypothetical protein